MLDDRRVSEPARSVRLALPGPDAAPAAQTHGHETWQHPVRVPVCAGVAADIESSLAATIDRLAARRLLIFSGKGGVGRTTVAAMLAVALTRRGRKVLLATTATDDRLAWLTGLDRLQPTVQRSAAGFDVQRLAPSQCLQEYGTLILHSERISRAVFDNTITRKLFEALPGLDDFTVLGKVWHESCRAKSYDTILFDGPASGHIRLTLGIPRAIMGTLPSGPLVSEAARMDADLTNSSLCAAVLVGLPELWPLTELAELAHALHAECKTTIGAMVLNGMPDGERARAPALALPPPQDPTYEFVQDLMRLRERAARQQREVDEWRASAVLAGAAPQSMLEVPHLSQGVHDLDALGALLDAAEERSHSAR